MANNLLQKFLDVGLFNFGDDDQRLKDFQAGAEDMAKEFAKSPAKVIPAVLVAIDPAVPDEDPVLDEAEAAIKNHWSSFRNKFPERPKAFLRPVIWEALGRVAGESPKVASAVWLSGANVFPHLPGPKEQGIVGEFLINQGKTMEATAEQSWALSQPGTNFTVPALTFKFPKVQGAKMDQSALEQGLAAASGPNKQNQPLPNSNPHFSNQGGSWSWEFAPRAAATISEQVNKALAPLANQAGALTEQVEPQLREFGNAVSAGITHWINASVKGLAQRSALIWWKEALYSPSLHNGYRQLSPVEVAVSMALDLHRLAPAPSPQSIEYFLRETIHSVFPKNPKVSISEALAEARRSKVLSDLLHANALPEAPRRVSLLMAIQFARHTKFEDNSVPAWLGVKGDLRQPLAELAVWLFRDAQAISLTLNSANE